MAKMKKTNQSYFLKSLLVITTVASFLLMTACSGLTSKKEPLSESEACEHLNELIAAHPNKFAEQKKTMQVHKTMHTWKVQSPFPLASNCQVMKWSSGLHGFVCKWNSKGGMEEAKADYLKGQQIIQSCLGNDWQEQTSPTKTGGERAHFSKSDSETVVSIRYFKGTRGILRNWHTVLYIGDESNFNSAVQ
jgi:hypothetical protein